MKPPKIGKPRTSKIAKAKPPVENALTGSRIGRIAKATNEKAKPFFAKGKAQSY